MHAVGDQLDDDALVVQRRERGAGLAVVDRAHRVVEVRGDPGAGVEPGSRLVVRRVRVAHRGHGAALGDEADEIERSRLLGRQCHDPHRAARRGAAAPAAHRDRHRGRGPGRAPRSGPREMNGPSRCTPARTPSRTRARERRDRPLHLLERRGHEARDDRRGPVAADGTPPPAGPPPRRPSRTTPPPPPCTWMSTNPGASQHAPRSTAPPRAPEPTVADRAVLDLDPPLVDHAGRRDHPRAAEDHAPDSLPPPGWPDPPLRGIP